MGTILNEGWPSDPFYNHFAHSTPTSSPNPSRRRSFSIIRHIERPFSLSHHDDIYTQTSSLQKKRFSLRSPSASLKDVKDEKEIEKSMGGQRNTELSEKGEEAKDGGGNEGKTTTYVKNLTKHCKKSENGKGGRTEEKKAIKYVTDLTDDYDSEEKGLKKRMTINEFFLAERKKDLAAMEKLRLMKKQQEAENSPLFTKTHLQRRATRTKVWLTPNSTNLTSNLEPHHLPTLLNPESQNISTITVNTSILFPSSPIPRRPPTSTPRIQTRKIPFPAPTASRFEIQNWLHALFHAHKTRSLPPFSLYHLKYTGGDLHTMASDSTPEASDLTREFVAEILKTGGVSVRQAEIVHWEILSFGEESMNERREGRGLARIGSVMRGTSLGRRDSFGEGRNSSSGDEERRVKMVPYMRGGLQSADMPVKMEMEDLPVGDKGRNIGVKKIEMSLRRRRVRKLVKGLVGLRISVKVEFKADGNDEM